MLIYGVLENQIQAAVNEANKEYEGNIMIERIDRKTRNAVNVKLTVRTSRGPGARLSQHNGRRMRALCWHGFAAVLSELFDLQPEARVKTSLAEYNGRNDFLQNYQHTGEHNIGSPMFPVAIENACLCNT